MCKIFIHVLIGLCVYVYISLCVRSFPWVIPQVKSAISLQQKKEQWHTGAFQLTQTVWAALSQCWDIILSVFSIKPDLLSDCGLAKSCGQGFMCLSTQHVSLDKASLQSLWRWVLISTHVHLYVFIMLISASFAVIEIFDKQHCCS